MISVTRVWHTAVATVSAEPRNFATKNDSLAIRDQATDTAYSSGSTEMPMTLYNVLMSFGVVVLIGILAKGFWGVTRIKPLEQPDNAQSDGSPPT